MRGSLTVGESLGVQQATPMIESSTTGVIGKERSVHNDHRARIADPYRTTGSVKCCDSSHLD
jgi:hypothetical protein